MKSDTQRGRRRGRKQQRDRERHACTETDANRHPQHRGGGWGGNKTDADSENTVAPPLCTYFQGFAGLCFVRKYYPRRQGGESLVLTMNKFLAL